MKESARLGEPVTSGVSLSSLGRVAIVPSAFFSINRREGEVERGFQGSEVERLEKREKEEKTKPRRYRITTLTNPYIVSCSVFFVRPSVSFAFKI